MRKKISFSASNSSSSFTTLLILSCFSHTPNFSYLPVRFIIFQNKGPFEDFCKKNKNFCILGLFLIKLDTGKEWRLRNWTKFLSIFIYVHNENIKSNINNDMKLHSVTVFPLIEDRSYIFFIDLKWGSYRGGLVIEGVFYYNIPRNISIKFMFVVYIFDLKMVTVEL